MTSTHDADDAYGSQGADAYPQPCRAIVKDVDEGSPAFDAGLEPGDVVTHVDGAPLRDMIEWLWRSDDSAISLTLEDGSEVELEREFGESWGLSFTDSVFDGIMTCCNACTFCFMRMLPKDMRSSLYLRDDDYRLSFLQGNFVTLSNVDNEELQRIIEYQLSPLHVSLHAVSPDVRERLIGKNAARGMEVLEAILDAGLEVHVQVVVVPDVNDGAELVKTLSWIEAHPGVLSAGFVPLGYTRFQTRFDSSFSDDPDKAAEVIEIIREFQEDSGVERLNPRLQIADEFYIDAGYKFPPAYMYAGYPQFQDGIGMMRSFIDEWDESEARIAQAACELDGEQTASIVTGTAFARVLQPLIDASPLAGKLSVIPVENAFFGGNVDVTGLICGEDLLPVLQELERHSKVLLSRQMFNQDLLLLDGVSFEDVEEACLADLRLCTFSPSEILDALLR